MTLAWFPWSHRHFECQNLTQQKIVCTLSLEPNAGFRPSFMYFIIGMNKQFDQNLVTLAQFSRSPPLRLKKIALSAVYLVNQCMDFDKTAKYTLLGLGKEMVRFRWPWPNFKVTTLLRLYKWVYLKLKANQCMDFNQTAKTHYWVGSGWESDIILVTFPQFSLKHS